MKILVAVDLSDSTQKIVAKVEELAQKFQARVWILHVAEPEPAFLGFKAGPQTQVDAVVEKFHNQHREIQEISERLRQANIDATALLVQGSTVDSILSEAYKLDVDLLVLGSHGHGKIYEALVGSVSKQVLGKSKCPILIIPTHKSRGI